MATRTLTAMFDSYDRAAEAVRKLEAAGIPHGDVSIVSNDASHAQYRDHGTADATGTGTGTGASLGTILGGGAGLLAGLGMLAIPGLGPVVAAGWLASTLVGAGVGAAAGGVIGALTGAGIGESDAHLYAEGIRRGGTLVTARVDDGMVERATDILDRDGSVDLDERASTWRGEGWTGTYTDAEAPYATGVGGAASTLGQGTTRPGAGMAGDVATPGAIAPTGAVAPTGAGTAGGVTDPVRIGAERTGTGRVRVYDQP